MNAYTLRLVIQRHEIAAEPFLFIGLIAAVRRILIVTAEFEQRPPKDKLINLLYSMSWGCSGSSPSTSPWQSS